METLKLKFAVTNYLVEVRHPSIARKINIRSFMIREERKIVFSRGGLLLGQVFFPLKTIIDLM